MTDFASKSQDEVRKADEEHLQKEREMFEAIAPILGSAGMFYFLKTIEEDRKRWLDWATADYDSVLNPTPIKAAACAQYAQSILDRVQDWKNRIK